MQGALLYLQELSPHEKASEIDQTRRDEVFKEFLVQIHCKSQ